MEPKSPTLSERLWTSAARVLLDDPDRCTGLSPAAESSSAA